MMFAPGILDYVFYWCRLQAITCITMFMGDRQKIYDLCPNNKEAANVLGER